MRARCKHCWHHDRAHLDPEISDLINKDHTKVNWLPLVRGCRTLYNVTETRCDCPGFAPDSKRYKHRVRSLASGENRYSSTTWVA